MDGLVTQVRRTNSGDTSDDEITSSGCFFSCFGSSSPKKRKPFRRDLLKIEKRGSVLSYCDPSSRVLLPPQREDKKGRKCLVLDLDETLVHSSFEVVPKYDFQIPVELEGTTFQVYVAKRPGVDEFLRRMGSCYEVVIFTASVAKYADPVLDLLDVNHVVEWRLFRESCTFFNGTYVKDMKILGRPISSIILIDNSPHSYAFTPENALPCESWFDDQTDTELSQFIPVLEEIAREDVQNVISELERRNMNGISRNSESVVVDYMSGSTGSCSVEQ
eukprot:TRINITY_DN6358_c0_g1_i5.p1 TRINITY_DN6358_c0_g1~~TRINITY_DN6358_c0_g1_i5.p1  ORF type:complete len:275 (+),score=39.93 TRINITY_DN6358_c0_g1_i5:182-1006(+)